MPASVLIGRGVYRDTGARGGGSGLVVTVENLGDKVNVTWTPDPLAITYKVRRVVGEDPNADGVFLGVVPAGTLLYVDLNPQPGKNRYEVTSVRTV